MSKNFINFYLLIFSIILSLILCEIFSRFYINSFNLDTAHKKISKKNKKFEKKNFEQFKLYRDEKILSIGGKSHSNIFLCKEKYPVYYKSDRFGFRNYDFLWSEKIAKDFLLIGDSFVHGECVKDEFTFSNIFNDKFNKKTINLGVGGSSSLNQLASVVEYGKVINPKFIIWFYFEGNDLDGLDSEFKVSSLKNYLKANYSQNLILKQNFIDQKLNQSGNKSDKKSDKKSDNESYNKSDNKSDDKSYKKSDINQKSGIFKDTIKLRYFRQLLTYASGVKLINTSGRKEELLKFEITTNRILDESEKLNAKLVFVYLPHLKNPYTFTSFEKNKVINIIKKKKIILVDIENEISDFSEDYFLDKNPNFHYSEETMNKVVKIIVSKL